jgi:hypothetical protein
MLETLSHLPVAWANGITVVLFAGIAVCCFLIPRNRVIADAPTRAGWRDLRLWAVALIVVQLAIYVLFS